MSDRKSLFLEINIGKSGLCVKGKTVSFSRLTSLNRCFTYSDTKNTSLGTKGRMRIEMIPSEQKNGLS